MDKPFWMSTTIIMNIVAYASMYAIAKFEWLGDLLTQDVQGQITAVVLVVLNILWRFKTKTAVTLR